MDASRLFVTDPTSEELTDCIQCSYRDFSASGEAIGAFQLAWNELKKTPHFQTSTLMTGSLTRRHY